MRKRTVACFVVAGLAIGDPAGALEEDRISYYLGAGLTYDDNFLRLPNNVSPDEVGFTGKPRGTFINTVSARAVLNLPVSRQLFTVDATVFHNRYADYSEFDFTGWNGNGRWVWELGNRWRGNLFAASTQNLSSFADLNAAVTRVFVRNIQTVFTTGGDADYWIHPNWRLTGGVVYAQSRNSAEQLRFSNVDQTASSLGVRYITTRENWVRLAGTYTYGTYPDREVRTLVSDTEFQQYDIGVDAYWKVEQKSDLTARIALTHRVLPNLVDRDFTGPTGRINWNWQITGKTGLNVLALREIGAVEDITATYIVTSTVSVAPYWAITSKVRAEIGYDWTTRDYAGQAILADLGFPKRKDTYNNARAGLSWFPTRNWTVSLNYTYSTRSSNYPGLDFTDNLVGLNVQFGW